MCSVLVGMVTALATASVEPLGHGADNDFSAVHIHQGARGVRGDLRVGCAVLVNQRQRAAEQAAGVVDDARGHINGAAHIGAEVGQIAGVVEHGADGYGLGGGRLSRGSGRRLSGRRRSGGWGAGGSCCGCRLGLGIGGGLSAGCGR